jgi:hypothetical protein
MDTDLYVEKGKKKNCGIFGNSIGWCQDFELLRRFGDSQMLEICLWTSSIPLCHRTQPVISTAFTLVPYQVRLYAFTLDF